MLVAWRLLLLAASAAADLSCRALDSPSMNSVITLDRHNVTVGSRCVGDLFGCGAAAATCLRSPRPCLPDCDAAGCVPFGNVCDGFDDCAALAPAAGESADERHCSEIRRSYRRTLRASIDIGRFLTFQVSLGTCAAYCFYHESCSQFSYSVTGGRQCKIGCDDCGWDTLVHQQSNAIVYTATAATRQLRDRLLGPGSGSGSDSGSGSGSGPGSGRVPLPVRCGLRDVVGPDTAQFELAVFDGGAAFLPRVAPPADLRVVGTGDRRATYGEFPWTAQLEALEGRRYVHRCGATIISDRYLITAAHCLGLGRSMYQVKVGQFDRRQLDSEEQVFAVQETILHPGYVDGLQNSAGYPDDIAVIQLLPRQGKGIVFSEKVQPLCVRSSAALPDSCLVSGWGRVSPRGPLADVLAGAAVPLVSNAFCGSSDGYGAAFNGSRQLCAGELTGGVDSCQGDSGGPLACFDGDASPPSWLLAGVVSFGDGCGRPLRPGVYTRVAAYYEWIVRTLQYLETR